MEYQPWCRSWVKIRAKVEVLPFCSEGPRMIRSSISLARKSDFECLYNSKTGNANRFNQSIGLHIPPENLILSTKTENAKPI